MKGLTTMKPNITPLLIAAACLLSGAALADGMFIAPIGSFMYEPVQQALIEWDAESGTEALTILPAFYGDANGFAWIVPVPGLPELALADRQLFYDLDDITRAIYRSRDGQWNCLGEEQYDIVAPGGVENGVDIISSETLGCFQTMVLSSDSAPALIDSLTTWGFLHADNIDDATEALNDYVDRSWFFVTMRVDSTALDDYYNDGYYYYPHYYGALDPITLTFSAEAPVYPMKISAYSAAENTRVNVYTKAAHRLTFPGAETFYANQFSAGELADLPDYSSLDAVLQPGDFLTKLQRAYSPVQMTEDIYFEQAAGDQEFRLINYSGWPVTTLLLMGPPLVWGLRRSFRSRRR